MSTNSVHDHILEHGLLCCTYLFEIIYENLLFLIPSFKDQGDFQEVGGEKEKGLAHLLQKIIIDRIYRKPRTVWAYGDTLCFPFGCGMVIKIVEKSWGVYPCSRRFGLFTSRPLGISPPGHRIPKRPLLKVTGALSGGRPRPLGFGHPLC